MPQVTYRSPIRVQLRHTFSADGLAHDVSLVPEPQTTVRLRQLGWLVRGNGPALSIHGPDHDAPSSAEGSSWCFGYWRRTPRSGLTPIWH
jgi:hypothetical protein